jgi:hypothetical protein
MAGSPFLGICKEIETMKLILTIVLCFVFSASGATAQTGSQDSSKARIVQQLGGKSGASACSFPDLPFLVDADYKIP